MPDAGCGDGAGYVGHGVVDGETGVDGAARGVDVEVYRFFGGFSFEVDELGFYAGGDGVVDGAVEEDDAFLVLRVGGQEVERGNRIRTMRSLEKMSSS